MSFVDSRVISQRMAAKDARMAKKLQRRIDAHGTIDQGRGRDVDASESAPGHNSAKEAQVMVDDQSSVGRPACTVPKVSRKPRRRACEFLVPCSVAKRHQPCYACNVADLWTRKAAR